MPTRNFQSGFHENFKVKTRTETKYILRIFLKQKINCITVISYIQVKKKIVINFYLCIEYWESEKNASGLEIQKMSLF